MHIFTHWLGTRRGSIYFWCMCVLFAWYCYCKCLASTFYPLKNPISNLHPAYRGTKSNYLEGISNCFSFKIYMCGFTKPVLNMRDCIQFKKICPRNDCTLKHQEKSLIKFWEYVIFLRRKWLITMVIQRASSKIMSSRSQTENQGKSI